MISCMLISTVVDMLNRHRGANKVLPLKDGFHSREQVAGGIRLYDIAERACAQGFLYNVRRAIFTYEEDFRVGRNASDSSCGFDSIQARESNIQQNQICLELPRLLNRFRTIRHFTDDLIIRPSVQGRNEVTPEC